ncbi:hypothetical protein [Streptomyces sp. NPDC060031]|uniref:hypothetical protein n=1 Tax=Streptomyces sp. NPDC060031 TaxID=3347043 RepID=UPI0036CE07B4
MAVRPRRPPAPFWSPGLWSARLAATGAGAGTLWWATADLLEAAHGPVGFAYSSLSGLTAIAATAATGAVIHTGYRLVRLLPDARLYPRARGRHIAAHTLSPTGRTLLERAQHAVDTVLGSAMHTADLIDRQANTVRLPAELWDIATALAQHHGLTSVRDAGGEGEDGGAGHNEALAAIERRVHALEAYTEQTLQADALHARWLRQQAVLEPGPGPREVLARTPAHELATADTDTMTSQAHALTRAPSHPARHRNLTGPAARPRQVIHVLANKAYPEFKSYAQRQAPLRPASRKAQTTPTLNPHTEESPHTHQQKSGA